MIDPTKPLETVPDERNPVPVRCERMAGLVSGELAFKICGDWFDEGGYNRGSEWWWFRPNGEPLAHGLPTIRNVPDPSTAEAPDAGCVQQDARDAVIAGFVAACEAYCTAYDAGTGTVYVEPMIREALARAKEIIK